MDYCTMKRLSPTALPFSVIRVQWKLAVCRMIPLVQLILSMKTVASAY